MFVRQRRGPGFVAKYFWTSEKDKSGVVSSVAEPNIMRLDHKDSFCRIERISGMNRWRSSQKFDRNHAAIVMWDAKSSQTVKEGVLISLPSVRASGIYPK